MYRSKFISVLVLFACSRAMAQDFQIGGDIRHDTIIPLEVRSLGVFVLGYLNGHGPYRFSIDVARNTMLTEAVVKDAGLITRDKGVVYDSYTDEKEQKLEVEDTTLGLGDSETSLNGADVIPEHNTAAYVPVSNYGGKLGVEIFRNRLVRLDLSHRQLVLSARTNTVEQPEAIEVPLEQSSVGAAMDRFPAVAMSLDGRPGRFRIDFSTGGVSFADNSSLGEDLLRQSTHPRMSLLWSPYETVEIQSTSVADIDIDGHRLGSGDVGRRTHPSRVSLRQSRRLYSHQPALDGVVGLSVLARFDISIDNLAGKAWLVPRDPSMSQCRNTPRPKLQGNTGFRPWDYRGHGVVLVLTEGSPAEAAGIRPGDEIVSINDGTVTDYYEHLDATCGASASEPAKVVFHNSSGDHSVVLTPAKY